MPVIERLKPEDLMGKSVLLPPEENGERYRAYIKCIEECEADLANDDDVIKFRASVKDKDEYDRILSYNDIINHIEDDENFEGVWKFKRITGHQGPLSQHDPNYKGSSYNVLVE